MVRKGVHKTDQKSENYKMMSGLHSKNKFQDNLTQDSFSRQGVT